MAYSSTSNRSEKPAKARPNFPLFAHVTGRWAKKIRGKLHYFGKWADAIMGHSRDDMASVYRERIGDDRLRAVAEHVRQWLWGKAARTAQK